MLEYSGDPQIYLDENGATLHFLGGQPDMDRGVVNMIFISLFTQKGWPGNVLFNNFEEQIGSDFITALREPITLRSLNNIRDAAVKALSGDFFGDVIVSVTNPISNRLKIKIELPGQALNVLLNTKNGLNWSYQIQGE